MERLQRVVTGPHRLRPAQSSKVGARRELRAGRNPAGQGSPHLTPRPATQITSDYRAEFARCLEPLLQLGPRGAAGAPGGANT